MQSMTAHALFVAGFEPSQPRPGMRGSSLALPQIKRWRHSRFAVGMPPLINRCTENAGQMAETDTVVFTVPWAIGAKKNRYRAKVFFKSAKPIPMIHLSPEAEREQIAIRDCARATLAYCNGAIDERELEEIKLNARKFALGDMFPREWSKYCESRNLDTYVSYWRNYHVAISVRLFPEPKGGASNGVTEITVRRLRPIDEHAKKRVADVDGSLTTVMDALAGLFYADDRVVDRAVAERVRIASLPVERRPTEPIREVPRPDTDDQSDPLHLT